MQSIFHQGLANWQDAIIFQLRNNGPKAPLHEPISKFCLMNFKFEVELSEPAISYQR